MFVNDAIAQPTGFEQAEAEGAQIKDVAKIKKAAKTQVRLRVVAGIRHKARKTIKVFIMKNLIPFFSVLPTRKTAWHFTPDYSLNKSTTQGGGVIYF